MDLIALAAAKNYANKVTAGFKSVELDGMNLIFTLLDDTKATVAIPAPADGKDGVSVKDLSIDTDGSLLCHMTDGTVIDAGYVPTVDPDLTNYYTKEEIDNLNNVVFIPIISHGNTGDTDEVNIAAAQKALSYIGKKDVIFRTIEKDTASTESMRYRLYFLSPIEYVDIEDISTYTGTLTWRTSIDRSLNLLNDLYYISNTTQRIDVYVENGKVTRLYGTSASPGSGGQYTTTSELALLSKTNTKAYTPTGDYHPATKKYVDDTIANTSNDPVPIYTFRSNNTYFTNGGTSFSTEDLTALTEIINDAYKKGIDYLVLNFGYSTSRSYIVNFNENLQDKPSRLNAVIASGASNRYLTNALYYVSSWQFAIKLTWEEDTCTISSAIAYYGSVPLLPTTNTAEYTPTGDYHPATKKYVDDNITNIDIPEVDLTNYYSKSEIGNLSSLVGWTTSSTAVGYFKDNPGIYDMMITLDIDTTTKDISVPSSQAAIILEMIKAHHKDKCFWLNLHTPSQSNGNHTLIPVHLSRFQNGETWKQVIPSFHFYRGELHIRNVEFETFTPVNGDNEPTSLKVRLLAETANSTIATKNDIAAAVSNISIPDMTNYYTKEEMKTTYLGLPIFEIPFEFSEIQDWIIENVIPYATENGWDSFYLKFTGLSVDPDQNYFKGLYFLESFHDISEEEERDYKIYYFKNICGYVHRIVDREEYTDLATMYPAVALYLNADNSVRGFETASVSDIGTNSATALRTDIDYGTPYMPLYDGSPATKLYVDNKVAAINIPETHDGEGMIAWYNTAADGEDLTSNYGVTPDMVRAVSAGDKISWPSRTMTGATENTICLYSMSYERYDKNEDAYLEYKDITIGKSPDSTYTYVIVGDNVYKNTY